MTDIHIEKADPSAPGGWRDEGRAALWSYLAAHEVDPLTATFMQQSLASVGEYIDSSVRLTLVREAT